LSVKNGYLYACHVDSNRFACYGVLVSKEKKLISTYNYCVNIYERQVNARWCILTIRPMYFDYKNESQ
jgi:hypothetical protein